MDRVKGSKISGHLGFVKDTYGEEMVRAVIGSMDADDQAALKIVLETGWYPFDLYARLTEAVCHTLSPGDESIYARMGSYSADQTFTTIYKTFRGKDPGDLLRKFVDMHAMRNDPAQMEIENLGVDHCSVLISRPRSTPAVCEVLRAFQQRALELSGAEGARVYENSCSGRGDAYCRFELSWKVAIER